MSASRTHRRPLGQLLDSVGRLLESWWRVDRIRISPWEGRLLRLGPGSLISVDERMVEIVGRKVRESAGGRLVEYDCRSADGPGRLCVSSGRGPTENCIHWCANGETRTLADIDVTVYRSVRGAC